jgi:hypothetical protein
MTATRRTTDWPDQRADGFHAARGLRIAILLFLALAGAVVLAVVGILVWLAPPAAGAQRVALTGGTDDHWAWIVGGVLIALLVATIAAKLHGQPHRQRTGGRHVAEPVQESRHLDLVAAIREISGHTPGRHRADHGRAVSDA